MRPSLSGARCTPALLLAAVVAAVTWLGVAAAAAQETMRGVALVIGQSDYEHLAPLANPANDADAIESLLSGLGFDSIRRTNRDASDLRRDLRRFMEDAADADVAVFYYAGHGIEAGGENYLVPVDADLTALDAAAERLVPISEILGQLRETVGVAVILLDACRDNPFPPGARLKAVAGSQPQIVSPSGLAAALTRGAARLATPKPAGGENYGAVVAFAAEPGRSALDGPPGTNSPYAAAILRHFDAMAGEEFGLVMRMVTEEVYLKTGGRQHPWVNESLRRLLYVGAAAPLPSGDEGGILKERRQLLVTIAALPDFRRAQVERVAAAAKGVPMDALYGMLRALGRDIPDDPAELETLLRKEAERFAKVLAEREVISSPDPQIVQLSALADMAEHEGLLAKADELRERAKVRFREIEPTLQEQEEALRRRFIEGASVFARSAETKALGFEHLAAAADYAEAFARVDGRDHTLAWAYKKAEMEALTAHGLYKGDNAALERAVAAGTDALRLAERIGDADGLAATQANLGDALLWLGERENGTARLTQAAQAYRASLDGRSREREPLDWAEMQSSLGDTLAALGQRGTDTEKLSEAIAAYRLALEEQTRARTPLAWARTQNSLGNALLKLGQRETGTGRLEQAVTAYRAALLEWTRERVPLDWATGQNNLGAAYARLAARTGDTAMLEGAIAAYGAALEEWTRERVPVYWGAAQANLGIALADLGDRTNDAARLARAIEAYKGALEELTRERVPLQWALVHSNLGIALYRLGLRENGTASLEASVETSRTALLEWTRDRAPLQWAMTQDNLGKVLLEIGRRSRNLAVAEAARDAHAASWAGYRELGKTERDDHFRKVIAEANALMISLTPAGGVAGALKGACPPRCVIPGAERTFDPWDGRW